MGRSYKNTVLFARHGFVLRMLLDRVHYYARSRVFLKH